MATFLDTSALAKLYHREIGSEVIERVVEQSAGGCFISRLVVLEMRSVLALKERTGAISATESETVRRGFRGDIRSRRFRVAALQTRHFRMADTLLESYGVSHGLRTLDSLQLAAALDLHGNELIDSMATADRVLSRIAPIEGLSVLDPESPSPWSYQALRRRT